MANNHEIKMLKTIPLSIATKQKPTMKLEEVASPLKQEKGKNNFNIKNLANSIKNLIKVVILKR